MCGRIHNHWDKFPLMSRQKPDILCLLFLLFKLKSRSVYQLGSQHILIIYFAIDSINLQLVILWGTLFCNKVFFRQELTGSLQRVKGSPTRGEAQLQTGLWLMTLHWALKPHTPGHGSTHRVFTQARFLGQSELMVHSGRHPPTLALPKKPGRHSQMAEFLRFRHTVLIPHGDGLQGSRGGSAKIEYRISSGLFGRSKRADMAEKSRTGDSFMKD